MNRVTYDTALEIASHEAVIRQAYKDSVNKWTWSVGLTSASGHSVERYIGKPQSLEHCLAVYAWALERYAEDVRAAFGWKPLTEEQFAAALSFHWNTGRLKSASWVPFWRAGQIVEARRAFMLWNKPSEIIPRREKECALFFDGKWSNNGTMTEYTRVRASGTPDWGSAKRINVEAALRAALGENRPTEKPADGVSDPAPMPTAPKPEIPPVGSPEPATGKPPPDEPTDLTNPAPAGFFSALVAWLRRLFT